MSDPFGILVEALADGDRFVQAEAARLLGELRRPAAAEPLVAFVSRYGFHTKLVGFHALAQLGDAGVCPAIRPLVDDPRCFDDWYWYGCKGVRTAAAVALLALGDEAGAGYLRQLADADEDVFFAWFAPAILRLPDAPPAAAELKARLTVEAICRPGSRKLRACEPGAMTMAAETLGLLGGPAACAKLRELMSFRSRYTRGQAAASLLEAAPTPEHLAAVAELAASDPTDFVRIKAHAALARAGRRESIAPVAAAAGGAGVSPARGEAILASQADAGLTAETAAVRAGKMPATHMGKMPMPREIDPFDQATAIECLGLLGAAEHAGLIRRQLASPDPYVRRCAIEALERLDPAGSRDAVVALFAARRGSSPAARVSTRDAVAALQKDADPLVRLQAAKFLATCEGGRP